MSRQPCAQELEAWRANGERIRGWRRLRGHTQRSLAAVAGVTQASLSNYESGKRELPLSAALALTNALEISLGDIVGSEDVIVLRDSRLGRAVRKLTTHPYLIDMLVDTRPEEMQRALRAVS